LAEDLRRFRTGEPIANRRRRPWRRAVRWLNGHRRVVVLAGAGLVAVLLLLAVFPFWKGRPPATTEEEDETADVALPRDLDVIPRDALAFVTINVPELIRTDVWKNLEPELPNLLPDWAAHEKLLREELGLNLADVERISLVASAKPPPLALIALRKPFDQTQFKKQARELNEPRTLQGMTYYPASPEGMPETLVVSDRILALNLASVFQPRENRPQIVERMVRGWSKPNAADPLRRALNVAARGHHLAVAGIHPGGSLFPKVEGNNPDPLGPYRWLESVRGIILTTDMSSAPEDSVLGLEVRLAFGNDVAREESLQRVQGLLSFVKVALEMQPIQQSGANSWSNAYLEFVKKAWASAVVDQKGDDVRVRFRASLASMVRPDVLAQWRESTQRTQSLQSLRQFGLAMHNYHQTKGHFPPSAIYSKDGKPLLSWRVELLPYLEQDKLYQQFHLDEPWDSEHNKKLLAQMPKLFEAPPSRELMEEYHTYFQVFVGKDAPFKDDPRKHVRITDFKDGTANTLLVVEAGEPVPWTKPADLSFDLKGPLPKLDGPFKDGFNAVFADGSVFFLRRSLKEETLRALITPAGGELIREKVR
jgi:hypothetical protein